MALHGGQRRWFALMIEAINALSARVDALGPGVRGVVERGRDRSPSAFWTLEGR